MAEDLRYPTEEERASLLAAQDTGIIPTAGNLLLVMGLYAVVNRCQWFPIPDDYPHLAIPGTEALKCKSIDLGRHSYLWPGVYSYDSLNPELLVDPISLEEWAGDGNQYRLGQSNTGLNGSHVKIRCHQARALTEGRSFSLDANTGSSLGDHDASIRLETCFARGFAELASLIADNDHGQDRAWELLLRSCDEDSDLIGFADILEVGLRGNQPT